MRNSLEAEQRVLAQKCIMMMSLTSSCHYIIVCNVSVDVTTNQNEYVYMANSVPARYESPSVVVAWYALR